MHNDITFTQAEADRRANTVRDSLVNWNATAEQVIAACRRLAKSQAPRTEPQVVQLPDQEWTPTWLVFYPSGTLHEDEPGYAIRTPFGEMNISKATYEKIELARP